MQRHEITFDVFIRASLKVAAFIGVLLLLRYLSGVLLPFVVAWGIAFLIYPIVTFFQHKCKLKNRVLSIVVTLLLLLGIITLVLLLIIPPMIEQSMRLKTLLLEYISTHNHNQSVPEVLENLFHKYFSDTKWRDILASGNALDIIKAIAPSVGGLLLETYNLLDGVVTFLATLLYLFFILLDYETMQAGWKRLLPTEQLNQATSIIDKVRQNMASYFRGQTIVAMCVGVLFAIGFSIIDFPIAIGLGLFIGILNLVPYLQLIGLLPTVLLALLKSYDTGESFWMILLSALAVFAIVQLIQDMVLTPRIMGKAMGMNPAIMLLSLSVWGSLLGFIGLIIGLPLTTLVWAYIHEFIEERNRRAASGNEKE